MNGLLAELRPYLEAAFFASGVVLALGLLVAYRQLRLLKADILIRNSRLAKEKAIEFAAEYQKDFIKLDSLTFRLREKLNLDSYDGPIGDFTFESIPKNRVPSLLVRIGSPKTGARNDELFQATLDMLNELELVAAAFATGVADDATGFAIFGRSFCHAVEKEYDVICLGRSNKPLERCSNIVSLYKLWRPRLTKAQMQYEQLQLQKRLDNLGETPVLDSTGEI